MTAATLNDDRISDLCGNRGGIPRRVAYAAAEAIAKLMGAELAVFLASDGVSLRICQWRYTPGTYRAEPTKEVYRLDVVMDDAMATPFAASGEHAGVCMAAMEIALKGEIDRIDRRGVVAPGGSDPVDVGFDPQLHRTM